MEYMTLREAATLMIESKYGAISRVWEVNSETHPEDLDGFDESVKSHVGEYITGQCSDDVYLFAVEIPEGRFLVATDFFRDSGNVFSPLRRQGNEVLEHTLFLCDDLTLGTDKEAFEHTVEVMGEVTNWGRDYDAPDFPLSA